MTLSIYPRYRIWLVLPLLNGPLDLRHIELLRAIQSIIYQ